MVNLKTLRVNNRDRTLVALSRQGEKSFTEGSFIIRAKKHCRDAGVKVPQCADQSIRDEITRLAAEGVLHRRGQKFVVTAETAERMIKVQGQHVGGPEYLRLVAEFRQTFGPASKQTKQSILQELIAAREQNDMLRAENDALKQGQQPQAAMIGVSASIPNSEVDTFFNATVTSATGVSASTSSSASLEDVEMHYDYSIDKEADGLSSLCADGGVCMTPAPAPAQAYPSPTSLQRFTSALPDLAEPATPLPLSRAASCPMLARSPHNVAKQADKAYAAAMHEHLLQKSQEELRTLRAQLAKRERELADRTEAEQQLLLDAMDRDKKDAQTMEWVTQTAAKLVRTKIALRNTTASLNETNTRLELVCDELDETQTQLDQTQTQLDQTQTQLDRTELQLGKMGQWLDTSELRLGRTQKRLYWTNQRLDRTGHWLTDEVRVRHRLERQVKRLRAAVADKESLIHGLLESKEGVAHAA